MIKSKFKKLSHSERWNVVNKLDGVKRSWYGIVVKWV